MVNHLLLKHGDIDHVLVGPGGAYAFETRWSATPWRWDGTDPRIQRAAEDARRHANTLSHWHPFKSVGATSVQAVVVLWGAVDPNASGDATARSSDGVPVLHGLDGLRRWRAYLLGGAGRGALTEDQIDAVWNGIDDHARKRDEKELAQPAPPTMLALYLRGCALIGVALLAFLANAQLLSLLHNLWLWFALVLAQALGAAIAGRKCRSRLAIHGWLVGVALCVLIGVVALTYYEVTGRPITAIS